MDRKIGLENVNKFALQHKFVSLLTAIIAIIIGVLSIISPAVLGVVLVWVIVGLFGAAALILIIRFIFPGKQGNRDIALFILGILLALLVAGVICAGVFSKAVKVNVWGSQVELAGFEATAFRIIAFLSIFGGIVCCIYSIFGLCSLPASNVERKGWVAVAFVLNIAIGVLCVVFPFIMAGISIIIFGVYLIIIGIVLIVFVCKNWTKKPDPTDINE